MTPIETIALIFIVVAAIKILVILMKPKAWANLVKKVWTTPFTIAILSLILAIIVLYYLTEAGITILHIFAVMLFTALLAAIGVSAYAEEITSLAQKLLRDKKFVKKAWLSIVIWILLILWGILTLFVI